MLNDSSPNSTPFESVQAVTKVTGGRLRDGDQIDAGVMDCTCFLSQATAHRGKSIHRTPAVKRNEFHATKSSFQGSQFQGALPRAVFFRGEFKIRAHSNHRI
jgi:hypothetical protein